MGDEAFLVINLYTHMLVWVLAVMAIDMAPKFQPLQNNYLLF